ACARTYPKWMVPCRPHSMRPRSGMRRSRRPKRSPAETRHSSGVAAMQFARRLLLLRSTDFARSPRGQRMKAQPLSRNRDERCGLSCFLLAARAAELRAASVPECTRAQLRLRGEHRRSRRLAQRNRVAPLVDAPPLSLAVEARKKPRVGRQRDLFRFARLQLDA